MKPQDILRFDRKAPRYTSYPTASDFTEAIDDTRCRRWLAEISRDEDLSLYIHIPFCDSLCWFCGCHTTVIRRVEIAMLAAALEGRRRVTHIHWGGGTPTILGAVGITRPVDCLREHFSFAVNMQFAVEIDPRTVTKDAIKALAAARVTRVSLGVHDFDPRVKMLINRIHSFETTKQVVGGLRDVGFEALNIDLLYGLPAQTEAGFAIRWIRRWPWRLIASPSTAMPMCPG